MAFKDELKKRVSDQLLAELTRPRDSDDDTINEVVLDQAIEDMKQDYLDETLVEFDETAAGPTRLGRQGTFLYLREYQDPDPEKNQAARDSWDKRLKDEALKLGRAAVVPTSVAIDPEDPDESRVPRFQDTSFNDLRPRTPRGGGSDGRTIQP